MRASSYALVTATNSWLTSIHSAPRPLRYSLQLPAHFLARIFHLPQAQLPLTLASFCHRLTRPTLMTGSSISIRRGRQVSKARASWYCRQLVERLHLHWRLLTALPPPLRNQHGSSTLSRSRVIEQTGTGLAPTPLASREPWMTTFPLARHRLRRKLRWLVPINSFQGSALDTSIRRSTSPIPIGVFRFAPTTCRSPRTNSTSCGPFPSPSTRAMPWTLSTRPMPRSSCRNHSSPTSRSCRPR